MAVLLGILRPLQAVNDVVLRAGRAVSIVAIALMVVAILVQVFCRYVLNNALPWPEEAARFLMLWMTGLMAPSAYRRGGFVAIDMLSALLPRSLAALLSLTLLILSGMVLVVGLQLGIKHVNSGWLFSSSSLRVPMEWIGMKGFKLKLAWMYMSLYVGLILLLAVNIELILRAVIAMFGGERNLRPLADAELRVE
ncbi:TRAP transporter small permease [Puniceibacterium sp. IMCC21224]|uniref:TRAP transporter small permease n=1 Tax=Puniceibacterium sp. IMCC21224 TaxID=1618204 RepID=UPI00064DEB4E|nr:TRAP transporter small permease subunit [Puniceibacterium sp. IMCC21224]KMK66732.1 TRAP-type C4-dicarboxylate transport system, small permease component [Puniceibacterium sp. IMCC21224]